jgi:molybdopterin molybdotransferase
MGGMPTALPYSSLDIPLASPIHSAAGRVDYVRVRVTANGAEPIPGSGGSRLSTTVEADGFMLVEAEREGLQVGEIVRVYRYDVP